MSSVVTDKFLHWVEIDPIDSPMFFGSTQLERYVLRYGSELRDVQLVFWHHDMQIRNVFFPQYDQEESYTVELFVIRRGTYNLLISRTDVKTLAAGRACVDFYKKLCTAGLDQEFSL
jgi:hypothetical protein